MRAFVAIPLSEDVASLLVAIRESIVGADPTWRGEKWVRAENLHLTLRFLGTLPEVEVPAVSEALALAVRGIPPFELSVTGVRAVPSAARATMIWATFADPSGGASKLATAVSRAMEPWAQKADGRPFRAHGTLVRARARRRVSADALSAADTEIACAARSGKTAMSVPRVMLLASTLTARGPVYEEVSSALLGGV